MRPRNLPSRGAYWALSRVRQALIRLSDPLVMYRIGMSSIELPLSHNLPHFQRAFPNYSQNLGRIAGIAQTVRPDLALVDVGANVGDSTAIVRSYVHVPVLAIEGDRRFFAVLEVNAARIGPDVQVMCTMVGAAPEQRRGTMSQRGGTAYYVERSGGSDEVLFDTLSHLIAQAPMLAKRKLLIKLDTDGFDCAIVKAEDQLLRERHPIVFFEYDPNSFQRYGDDGFAAFAALRQAGYTNALVYENTGELRSSLSLDQEAQLRELDAFYQGRRSERYADVCAFHQEDADVFERVRSLEREFFSGGQRENESVIGSTG